MQSPDAMEKRFRKLADKLMLIAARRSTETSFGWSHPDCETLEEAAHILRGEKPPRPSDRVEGVLSESA